MIIAAYFLVGLVGFILFWRYVSGVFVIDDAGEHVAAVMILIVWPIVVALIVVVAAYALLINLAKTGRKS